MRVLTELLRDGGGNPEARSDQVDREVVGAGRAGGRAAGPSSRLDFQALSPRPLDAVDAAARALDSGWAAR